MHLLIMVIGTVFSTPFWANWTYSSPTQLKLYGSAHFDIKVLYVNVVILSVISELTGRRTTKVIFRSQGVVLI